MPKATKRLMLTWRGSAHCKTSSRRKSPSRTAVEPRPVGDLISSRMGLVSTPPWSRSPPDVEPDAWVGTGRAYQRRPRDEWRAKGPAGVHAQEDRALWLAARGAGAAPTALSMLLAGELDNLSHGSYTEIRARQACESENLDIDRIRCRQALESAVAARRPTARKLVPEPQQCPAGEPRGVLEGDSARGRPGRQATALTLPCESSSPPVVMLPAQARAWVATGAADTLHLCIEGEGERGFVTGAWAARMLAHD